MCFQKDEGSRDTPPAELAARVRGTFPSAPLQMSVRCVPRRRSSPVNFCAHAAIILAARHPIGTAGAFVLQVVMVGIAEASATQSPSTWWMRSCGSTTDSASVPRPGCRGASRTSADRDMIRCLRYGRARGRLRPSLTTREAQRVRDGIACAGGQQSAPIEASRIWIDESFAESLAVDVGCHSLFLPEPSNEAGPTSAFSWSASRTGAALHRQICIFTGGDRA